MKLHEDPAAFQVLLSSVSERSGIREDIIEKDYYLTMLLSELATQQEHLPAYFKGGTALYKALGRMIRFSEDIDLTVESQDCSRSQAKKRLELAANGYRSLARTSDKEREDNRRGSITSVYEYTPITVVNPEDALQRFGYVKVEATSFTISEPYEMLMVAPLIYQQATEEERGILRSQYDVDEFPVATITQERIFADKILAAEFYYERDMLFDVAKHLFDLTVMMRTERIQCLLADSEELIEMLSYKRQEEEKRIGSDLSVKPFSDFSLFPSICDNPDLRLAYDKMQRIYVFDDADMIPYDEVIDRINSLYNLLLTLDEDLEPQQNEQGFSMNMTM